jgi:hypothetical protein
MGRIQDVLVNLAGLVVFMGTLALIGALLARLVI